MNNFKQNLLRLFVSKKAAFRTLFLLTALVMSIVMIVNLIPPSLVAAALPIDEGGQSEIFDDTGERIPFPKEDKSGTEALASDEDEEIQILAENTDRRTATQKHFIMSDGSYVMQDYGTDVHYYDENKKWRNIDNTLKENNGFYENKNNSFKVQFAASSSGRLVKLSENKIEIVMDYIGANKNVSAINIASLEKSASVNSTDSVYKEDFSLRKKENFFSDVNYTFKDDSLSSKINDDLHKTGDSVKYNAVLPNADFEYILDGRSLKENIIIGHPGSNYVYSFSLSVKNATAVLEESGDIIIYDLEGNPQYRIPKGYMYDAEGNYSGEVEYSLSGEAGSYTLTVKADAEWINAPERAFPVTVDPTIATITSGYTTKRAVTDGAIIGNDFYTQAACYLYLGISMDTVHYGLIKYSNLTNFNNCQVKTANLSVNTSNYSYRKYNALTYENLSWGRFSLNCHMLQGNWDIKENVLNARQIGLDRRSDSQASNSSYLFNVTEYVLAAAASQDKNHGLRINPDRESGYEKGTNLTNPVLTVYYALKSGLNPKDTYITQDMGESGTGYFNTHTGQVIYQYGGNTYGNAALPFGVSTYWDSMQDPSVEFLTAGRGIINLDQKVSKLNVNTYVYCDGTGREILFKQQCRTYKDSNNNEVRVWVIGDTDGLGMEITEDSSYYYIRDRSGNELKFSTYNGRIIQIKDSTGHICSFSYSALDTLNLISTFTDSGGNVYNFGRNLLFRIKSVSSGGAALLTYNYSVLDLTSIVNNVTGVTTSFQYTGNLLKKVTSGSRSVEYTYDGSGKCTKIVETKLGVAAETTEIFYCGNITRVTSSLLSDSIYYSYNEDGTLNSVYKTLHGSTVVNPKIATGYGVDFVEDATIETDNLLIAKNYFSGIPENSAIHVRDKATSQSSYLGSNATILNCNNSYVELVASFWMYIPNALSQLTAYAKVIFEDNTEKLFNFNFDKQQTGFWQFSSAHIKTATDKIIKNVTIYYSASSPVYIDRTMLKAIPYKISCGSIENPYTLDSSGRVISEKIYNAVSGQQETISYTYDSRSNLTSVSKNGKTTTYTYNYNSNGKIAYIVEAYTVSGVSGYIQKVYHYNDDGSLTAYVDENGTTSYYSYANGANGERIVTETSNGISTSYKYSKDNSRLLSVSNGAFSNNYTYNDYGQITNISAAYSGGAATNTSIVYDANGNVSKIFAGNYMLVQYGYDSYGNISFVDYGNNQALFYTYNGDGQLKTKTYAGQGPTYTYDKWGNLTGYKDDLNKTEVTYQSYNDSIGYFTNGQITQKTGTGAYSEEVKEYYDPYGRLISLYEWNNAKNGGINTSYSYNNSTGNLASQTGPLGTFTYGYDQFNRFTSVATGSFLSSVSYTANKNQISNLTNKYAGSAKTNYTYTYDGAGRIKGITGTSTSSYEYDSYGRLVRENNAALGETYIFSYGNYQDLTSTSENCYRYLSYKQVYPYTTGTPVNSTRIEYLLYYNNGWWDQLTAVHVYNIINGNYIPDESKSYAYTYDARGNMLSAKNLGTNTTVAYTWTRGTLLSKAGGTTYKYDMSGLRTEKTVNGVTTQYFWHGDRLYGEKRGDMWIEYYYDATGIRGMLYNGTQYYFEKNMQGDVVAIYHMNGNIRGTYVYDAYGNCTATSIGGSIATEANPFRYRGYYRDAETGFYYLQTRYYNPQMLGFISPDDPFAMLLSSGIPGEGTDLYAYCLNDPVNMSDETGNFPISTFVGFGIGASIGAIISVISQGLTYGWDNINGWQVLSDSLFGGVSGMLSMSGVGVLGQSGVGALLSVAQTFINAAIRDEEVTAEQLYLSMSIGILSGLLGGNGLQYGRHASNAIRGLEKNVMTEFSKNGLKAGAKAYVGHLLLNHHQAVIRSMLKIAIMTAGANTITYYIV